VLPPSSFSPGRCGRGENPLHRRTGSERPRQANGFDSRKHHQVISFDQFILEDSTDHILINSEGIKQKLKLGDSVLCYGRYAGKISHPSAKAQLDVRNFAYTNETAAVKDLLDKYAPQAAPTAPRHQRRRFPPLRIPLNHD